MCGAVPLLPLHASSHLVQEQIYLNVISNKEAFSVFDENKLRRCPATKSYPYLREISPHSQISRRENML